MTIISIALVVNKYRQMTDQREREKEREREREERGRRE
jgi:hypothetical protein